MLVFLSKNTLCFGCLKVGVGKSVVKGGGGTNDPGWGWRRSSYLSWSWIYVWFIPTFTVTLQFRFFITAISIFQNGPSINWSVFGDDPDHSLDPEFLNGFFPLIGNNLDLLEQSVSLWCSEDLHSLSVLVLHVLFVFSGLSFVLVCSVEIFILSIHFQLSLLPLIYAVSWNFLAIKMDNGSVLCHFINWLVDLRFCTYLGYIISPKFSTCKCNVMSVEIRCSNIAQLWRCFDISVGKVLDELDSVVISVGKTLVQRCPAMMVGQHRGRWPK